MYVRQVKACGNLSCFCANLIKLWLSPIGTRLMGRGWWLLIDSYPIPLYATPPLIDPISFFQPSNLVLVGKKQELQ